MSDDRRRPGQYTAERDAALGPWLSGVVHPYSAALRPAIDRAGGTRAITTTADLGKLPIVGLADIGDGRTHVLEPSATAVAEHGPASDRMRLAMADLFGRRQALARREVEPAYKPVVWTTFDGPAGPVFVANTTTDLDRLAELGRRGLAISGVGPGDRVLVLDPAGAGISPWQFLAGARDAGVAVLHLDPASADGLVAAAAPTVLAGSAASLIVAVDAGLPATVGRLVVHDGRRPDRAQAARLSATGLPVAEWWTPPGARAAWVRCPGGDGFHTWPTAEVVELVDDAGRPTDEGRLVWTPIGWHGSVWLRVDTGSRASVATDACERCGRTTPRVVPAAPAPAAPAPSRRRGRLTVGRRGR